ncbi:MAG: lysine--tRNA ligase [Candidatus Omnitrophica bacterium]|nr:lysine--tRNA ligase [Candidatus Omnitrophota bacterium]
METDLLEIKKEKIKLFQENGLYDYPPQLLKERQPIDKVLINFQEKKEVVLAGRLMAKRLHGKAIFYDLEDFSSKMQVYIKEDIVGKELFSLIKDFDIGDIVLFKGELFKTKTQQPTLNVKEVFLLSKNLRSLPEKWHGLKDIEIRYRQRYLDIISNKEVKELFIIRSRLIKEIRNFLDSLGFIEVETPMMQPIPGGARGRPFKTYHNEYGLELYLRIAPELYLKKLLVAGFEKIYELNRSFRNEGISTKHNPEFTMLEVYSAYSDYRDMMELVKNLIIHLAKKLLGKDKIVYQKKEIDLNRWQEVSFSQLLEERYGIKPQDSLDTWIKKLKDKGIKVLDNLSRSFIINLIADLIEPESMHPVFVTDLYTVLCPLAKRKKENPLLSERFELFIGGIEVANAYSELNDPIEQRQRFEEELNILAEGVKIIDEDFLLSLEYGMPPAGGLGIGIDRLAMIFLDQASIKDVILFPLLKP